MNQTIQPPPFIEPPTVAVVPEVLPPVVRPAVHRPPRRSFPGLPILAGFAAGWLVAQVPLPKVASDITNIAAYTPEQRAVLEWVQNNLGEPDIEIIEFNQRTNVDGVPIVTLKYRGKWMGDSRRVWTRQFQVKDGTAMQFHAE